MKTIPPPADGRTEPSEQPIATPDGPGRPATDSQIFGVENLINVHKRMGRFAAISHLRGATVVFQPLGNGAHFRAFRRRLPNIYDASAAARRTGTRPHTHHIHS